MLKDEKLSVIQDEFERKAQILAGFGEEVSPATFYEHIYGDLDMLAPIVIIDDDEQKHILKMSIQEALDICGDRNDMLLGGSTYFKEYISKTTAKDIRALIIDMDNVYSRYLADTLREGWSTVSGKPIPMPTYIVNSGTGLHLYYLFTDPVPHYKVNALLIDEIYRSLALLNTEHRGGFVNKQVQWFGQDFRMAGSLNKYNWTNRPYLVGSEWDIDDLAEALGFPGTHLVRYGEPRTAKPVIQKKSQNSASARKGWYSNPAFYNYTLRRCHDDTKEGNRYMSLCALSVIAWKCKIPKQQLEEDLEALIRYYNTKSENLVKPKEIQSAIKMYNSKAMRTKRYRIEDWIGWKYDPIKRNDRKRFEHLRADVWEGKDGRPAINVCAQNRELALKFMREHKQIPGRSIKKEKIIEYRLEHPEATKTQCHIDTGISRPTIAKWWNFLPEPTLLEQIPEPKAAAHMPPLNKYHPNEALPGINYTFIQCRGCTMKDRERLWLGYCSSITDNLNRSIDNSYLDFEPEPDNHVDPHAIKIICKGEFFGDLGYVAKEKTDLVRSILAQCSEYRIDMVDEDAVGSRDLELVVRWKSMHTAEKNNAQIDRPIKILEKVQRERTALKALSWDTVKNIRTASKRLYPLDWEQAKRNWKHYYGAFPDYDKLEFQKRLKELCDSLYEWGLYEPCPKCKKGIKIPVWAIGATTPFCGCSNYPECDFSMDRNGDPIR